MAAFQKLRNLIDDKPEILDDKSGENVSLASSCQQLNEAASRIRTSERSRRELFSAPTNPSFIEKWGDYKARYSGPVARIATWLFVRELFGELCGGCSLESRCC